MVVLLNFKVHQRSARSSSDLLLEISKTHLESVGDRAFTFNAAIQWNALLLELGACQLLSVFKKNVKTFLFVRSYPVAE